GCFSFYPTKNLGGLGDGGIVTTSNKKIYDKLFLLRDCGRKKRYEHLIKGYNSRLDTLQAAVLRVKLKKLDKWNAARRKNARLYDSLLKDTGINTPFESKDCRHVYHQYVIRSKNRDRLLDECRKKGIAAAIYYPLPLHLQPAYKELGYKKGSFRCAEKIAKEVLSLPMHPYLTRQQIECVADTLKKAV
ncbi:MAG: DegT/DnrJ/EryC1/StrS family aminotransferase, partial [Candidatus Omnitrophica bacterium]|nr:DegT/DnrJ/EryC1/StrS family aminotransferase [Candidatus Omnitrophota bacterium]